MPATQSLTSRKSARKSSKAPARPVQQMLLEIAYRLHATKSIGLVPAAAEQR